MKCKEENSKNDSGKDDIPGVVGSTSRGSRKRCWAQESSGGVKAAPEKISWEQAVLVFIFATKYPFCHHNFDRKLTLCSQELKQGQMHCWNALHSSLDKPTLRVKVIEKELKLDLGYNWKNQPWEWKKVKTGWKWTLARIGGGGKRGETRVDEVFPPSGSQLPFRYFDS